MDKDIIGQLATKVVAARILYKKTFDQYRIDVPFPKVYDREVRRLWYKEQEKTASKAKSLLNEAKDNLRKEIDAQIEEMLSDEGIIAEDIDDILYPETEDE